jgi:MFS family permease
MAQAGERLAKLHAAGIMPLWIVALAVVLVLQTVAAYLTRLIPVASPAFMAEFGWDESWIGYLSAFNIIGAICVLLGGMGLLRRMDTLLVLQTSIVIGAAALFLFQFPSIVLALLASALIGISNGTSAPAGTEVLMRYTPASRYNLAFSIRQAGVPLGGVAAGLAIPLLIDAVGWRAALMVSALGAFVVTALLLPFRTRIDGPREPLASGLRGMPHFAHPLRLLSASPGLRRIVLVGGVFAVAQACWFTFAVTYLVVELRYPLGLAGMVFAAMQAAGVIGRIALGMVADRSSSDVTLAAVAVLSAVSTAAFAYAGPDWPVWSIMSISIVAGATVSGWNGVQVAEVVRRSPRELVTEAVAGSVIVVFASNMLAPVLFAMFVAATKRFDLAFLIAGLCSLLCLPMLTRQEAGRQ